MGSQTEATAAAMSACLGVPVAVGHGGGHGSLLGWGASTEAGATHPPACPGEKSRDLGTEKGHFENTTHKCFS